MKQVYCRALEAVLKLYDGIPADSFSPKALKAVRNVFVERGYARNYCNKLTQFIKAAFRWGVEEELVNASTYHALRCVAALEAGRTKAPESKKRVDAKDETVQATLPFQTPTVRTMGKFNPASLHQLLSLFLSFPSTRR
jgi:hypothetical protein